MKHDLQRTILDIIDRCTDMTVATVRPDGAPQATVVSFAHDGLVLYFGCGATSQKAVNIAHEPRIAVTMTAPYDSWTTIRGLSIAATATEVTVPGEIAEITKLMLERFPQIAGMDAPAEMGAVRFFRIRPQFVSVLDYTRGFGHTELVAIGADDVAESLDSMRHHWLVTAEEAQ